MVIREHLFHKRAPADPMFRWRGGDISRMEALSDGVFAVTLTLLIVSLNVPGTFHALWLTIRDMPAFLASFIMLMMAWRYHYLFFRRYGLEDFLTSLLNGAFLFLVVFYAYPLKFMAMFLWRMVRGQNTSSMFVLPDGVTWTAGFGQQAGMMYFYGLGVVGVFGLLTLMVWRAYSLRDEMELDELETYLTRTSIRSHLITVGVALLSITVQATTGSPGLAGMTYFLMGPLHGVAGWRTGLHAAAIQKRLLAGQMDAL